MEYVAVFVLAAIVAAAELVARYKDNPLSAVRSLPAVFYIAFNGVIGLAALYILVVFAPDLFGYDSCAKGAATGCVEAKISMVLAAAFGSLAVMRSAFARVTIEGQDLGIGPSAIIEIFQRTADREVDRQRAFRRMDELPKKLREMPLDIVNTTLPALCVELMQNLSAEEKQGLDRRIKLIAELRVHEKMRPLIVALILQEVVGKDALVKAFDKIVTDYKDVLDEITAERSNAAAQIDAAAFGGADDAPPPTEGDPDIGESNDPPASN
jgi:hypothetical protein